MAMLSACVIEFASLITGRQAMATRGAVKTIRYSWYFDSTKTNEELKLQITPLEKTLRDCCFLPLRHEDTKE
jgi:hypothetical protein